MDQLAEELGLDRFEIRRRNFIAENEFPYPREGLLFADGLKVTLDSGQYHKALDMMGKALDVTNFAAEKERARRDGKYLGLGLAFYVEGTGLGPYEGGHMRIHPITGKVYVNTGLTSQGQGHDTVFAQIVADQLGVKPQDVIVVEGDTKAFDWGVATFASRAAVVSGNAIHKTALMVREKTLKAAANMLEVDVADIELHDGAAWVKGSNRFVPLAAIATATNPLRYAFNEAAQAATQFAPASRHDGPPLGEGQAPGLEGDRLLQPAVRDLGLRRPRRHRRGRPATVHGQDPKIRVHPRLRQHDQSDDRRGPGAAAASPRASAARSTSGSNTNPSGNLANANFVDFLVPYATEIPNIEVLHLETPSPLNPLGVKGVGEAGCIAVGAVVASGVEDALQPLGAGKFRHVPLTPSMIQAALDRAGA